MKRPPLSVKWLAWAIPVEHRQAVVDDLLEAYERARAGGRARRARIRLTIDLLRSARDSRRQARLDRRTDRHDNAGGRVRPVTRRLSETVADLRFAWRQQRAHPAGTLSAVATIALAIGVNTALVSVTQAVLLKPLPFRDTGRIVFVWDDRAGNAGPFAPARALDVRRRAGSLESAALLSHLSVTVTGLGPPERWAGASVSASFFDVLGAPAELGQAFHDGDAGRDLVVLSHRLWVTRFGGDRAVIGRTITMAGRPRTIVGVMGADFFWPTITAVPAEFDGPTFWSTGSTDDVPEVPSGLNHGLATNRTAGFARMVARLAPGVRRDAAAAELSRIAVDLGREYPATDGGHGLVLRSVDDQFFAGVRRPVWYLLGASALVLLLACVNVATLLLMRLPGRARELAVRVALGASRARLVRQLIVEAFALAAAGGLAGVAVAWASLRGLVTLAPGGIARLEAVAIDLPVLVATAAAVGACGLALGALPAIIVWRARPMLELRASGASLDSKPRLRQTLVAMEVGLAVTLVVGAALFGQSLVRLQRVDVGFDTRRLLTFDVALGGDRADFQARQLAFYERMFDAIRSLPGVVSVGGAVTLPIGGDDFAAPLYAEGEPLPAPGAERHVGYQVVAPGWFETLGVRLVSGREFLRTDTRGQPEVVIVNETLASRLWPGQDAVGKRVRLSANDPDWLTVVGVVSDIRHHGPASPPRPEFYRAVRAAVVSVHRGGRTDGRRPAGARRTDSRGRRRARSWSAHLRRRHDVGLPDARVRRRTLSRVAHARLRRARAAAGRHRRVWRRWMVHRAARAGVRVANGTGRDAPKSVGSGSAAGADAGPGRGGGRHRGRGAAGACNSRPALRNRARRSSPLCRGTRGGHARRGCRVLAAGEAGRARGSGANAQRQRLATGRIVAGLGGLGGRR